jgi:hypothetical protein
MRSTGTPPGTPESQERQEGLIKKALRVPVIEKPWRLMKIWPCFGMRRLDARQERQDCAKSAKAIKTWQPSSF